MLDYNEIELIFEYKITDTKESTLNQIVIVTM